MRAFRCTGPALAASLLAFAAAQPASAQEAGLADGAQDSVIIGAGEGGGVSGRLAVNIAAGNGNQQLGDAVVVAGGVALGTQVVTQDIAFSASGDRATLVSIGAGAFSNNSGLTSINVTAGNQNQSANLALLAVGNSGALTDQALAQSRASIEPTGGSGGGAGASNDTVSVSETAFGESSGLIQVNLIGGEGNSSANTFSLSVVSAGDQP